MKKMICLFSAAILSLSLILCGCGSSDITGEWRATMDVGPSLKESFSTMEEFSHIDFDGIDITFVMKLSKSGEFSLHIEEASSLRAVDTLIDRIVASLPAFREDQAEKYGVSVEDIIENDDMTDEEFEASLKESYGGLSLTDLADIGTEYDGYYSALEGIIYISRTDKDVSSSNSDGQIRYSRTDENKLSVYSITGADSFADEDMFPLTFVR